MVGFIIFKHVVPDPGKPEPKQRHVDEFEQVKGEDGMNSDQDCQPDAYYVQSLVGFVLVLFEVLDQEGVGLLNLLLEVLVHLSG